MTKKILFGVIIVLIVLIGFFVFRPKNSTNLQLPLAIQNQEPAKPSETLTVYSDPSGFSFSYPDNLSITARELDDSTYADLVLSSKDVSGSINFKITDSEYKTLDEWAKLNKGEETKTKLGNLDATQIQTSDRLILGALDQGIFFNVEMPKIEEEFWNQVYQKLLTDFSFETPEPAAGSNVSEVSFEGEEVVE